MLLNHKGTCQTTLFAEFRSKCYYISEVSAAVVNLKTYLRVLNIFDILYVLGLTRTIRPRNFLRS